MHEWTVKLKRGGAVVYAHHWEKKKLVYHFYVRVMAGYRSIKQFSVKEVVSIQKTYPEVGEIHYNNYDPLFH